jgi:hypothetical protein
LIVQWKFHQFKEGMQRFMYLFGSEMYQLVTAQKEEDQRRVQGAGDGS